MVPQVTPDPPRSYELLARKVATIPYQTLGGKHATALGRFNPS